jgi:hypothetical protein
VLEERAVKIILGLVGAGSYSDGISLRILPGTTAEILVAPADHGPFDFDGVVHEMKPPGSVRT